MYLDVEVYKVYEVVRYKLERTVPQFGLTSHIIIEHFFLSKTLYISKDRDKHYAYQIRRGQIWYFYTVKRRYWEPTGNVIIQWSPFYVAPL